MQTGIRKKKRGKYITGQLFLCGCAFGQKAGLCRKREHLYLFHNDQLYTSGDRSDRGFGRRSLCCDPVRAWQKVPLAHRGFWK